MFFDRPRRKGKRAIGKVQRDGEVYFDDFKVEHIKSPVIQSDDYYPFGLRYNSYSRENSLINKSKLFQGQEHVDDLGLNWDSFKWRNYMPEIGRFFNIDPLSDKYLYNSPYAFSENHVTSHVELEGLEMVDIKQDATKKEPPPQQKGKPDDGKSWTGFDGLNFTQGMEKETGGEQQIGIGALIHNSDGGGPDEQYLKKADPMAALLDVDKDGLDALMAIGKTMPRGGGVGTGMKNTAEGADKLREVNESGENVADKVVANMRRNASDNPSGDSAYRVEYGVASEGIKNVGYTHTNGNGDKVYQFRTINVPTRDTSELMSKIIKGNN